jgi:putative hydrolase of the HAD superfamily
VNRITAVITDFGGVLTSPLLNTFAAAEGSTGIGSEDLGKAFAAIWERGGDNPLFELETGKITEAAFLGELSHELTTQLGRPVEMEGFGERFFEHLQVNEPMLAFMRQLHGRGYRLAICTNNIREWEARWRAMLPIDEIFDDVVDSAFVGVRKPDREIYELALERLGVGAAQALFIDDVELNCDGARAVGIEAVWFRGTEQAIAEIEAALSSA